MRPYRRARRAVASVLASRVMASRRWSQVLVILCLAACGPLSKRPGGDKPAAGVKDGAARVPANVTAAVVVAHLGEAVRVVRELVSVADTTHETSMLPAIDQASRQELGVSLIDPADLAAHGVDVEGPASLALDGTALLVAVHAADAAKVEALVGAIAQKLPGGPAKAQRGHQVLAIRTTSGLRVEAVVVDGWLHLRAGADDGTSRPSDGAWVDRLLDRQPLAGDGDFTWALAQGGGRDGAVMLVRWAPLLAAISPKPEDTSPACVAMEAGVQGAIARLGFAANLADAGVDAQGTVELARELRDAIKAHTGPVVDEKLADARVMAAMVASLALDIDWLGTVGRAHDPRCGSASALVAFTFGGLVDPLEGLYGKKLFDSIAVALLSVRMPGATPEPTAIARLGVVAHEDLDRLLDTWVPSLLRSNRKVGGEDVFRVDLSMLGAPGPIEVAPGGRTMTVALGDGLLEPLLGEQKPLAERELASIQLRPDRIPDLAGPLGWLADKEMISRGSADTHARLFARFAWIGLRAVEAETGLSVTAGYKLR